MTPTTTGATPTRHPATGRRDEPAGNARGKEKKMKNVRLTHIGLAALFALLVGVPTTAAYAQGVLFVKNNRVGIGVDNPGKKLQVRGTDGATQLLVQEQSATEAARTVAELQNNGVTYFRMVDTSPDGSNWTFQTAGPSFRFNKAGTGAAEVTLRGRNDEGGLATLTVDGSIAADNVSFTSSRATKTDFVAIDRRDVLDKVAGLEVSEWRFKDEQHARRHIGPIAEDFAETFDLGGTSSTVSMIDASGVAFAAIQGLYEVVQEKDATISDLRQENEELADRLDAIEAALASMSL